MLELVFVVLRDYKQQEHQIMQYHYLEIYRDYYYIMEENVIDVILKLLHIIFIKMFYIYFHNYGLDFIVNIQHNQYMIFMYFNVIILCLLHYLL